jgi:hypothetical protein
MLPRKAKGRRPIYSGDPQVDKLYAMVMALAGEVSVLRERIDTTERLLSMRGILTSADIEHYQFDEAALAERENWRTKFLERVLRVVTEEVHNEGAG